MEENKPSYEKLEEMYKALASQNNQLMYQLQNMNMSNLFKRLDYLFKVLEVAPKFTTDVFSPEFVTQCAKEIESYITPSKSEEELDIKE